MSLSDLPDDVFSIIVKKLGDEDFSFLGPVLRTNKKGRDIALSPQILNTTNLDRMSNNPQDFFPGQPARIFFTRCLEFGNVTATYLEALRLISKELDVHSSLTLLNTLVPMCGHATLAYAMFQMCAGRGDIAGSVLKVFLDEFGGPRSTYIYSEVVYDMCEALISTLMRFDPRCQESFGFVWEFPSCETFGIPTCEDWHGDGYYCEGCYLYLSAVRISELL